MAISTKKASRSTPRWWRPARGREGSSTWLKGSLVLRKFRGQALVARAIRRSRRTITKMNVPRVRTVATPRTRIAYDRQGVFAGRRVVVVAEQQEWSIGGPTLLADTCASEWISLAGKSIP